MADMQSAYHAKLGVHGTTTIHLRIGEPLTRVRNGVMEELGVPVLLETIFSNRQIM